MAAVDSPLSHLLKMFIFLPGGVSFSLRSRLGALMHNNHKKKHIITAQTLRRTIERT